MILKVCLLVMLVCATCIFCAGCPEKKGNNVPANPSGAPVNDPGERPKQ